MSKVFFVSLGCARNLVDSEYMLGLIQRAGYGIADDPSGECAAVVNTCAFIQPAVEEAIDTILELVELKKRGDIKSLIVTGCFVQRYGKKLTREIPEVDAWIGTGQISRIVEALDSKGRQTNPVLFIDRPRFLAEHHDPRVQATPFYQAYLKISEGCSHRCSYCIIPSLRGPLRSRSMDSLVIEAGSMVERGVKEINIVAQDTTSYGRDLKPPCSLEILLERLLKMPGLRWLRLLYTHPYYLSGRLLDLVDSEEALCPYLDLPMQHVDEDLLRIMGRPMDISPYTLVESVRRRSRNIALRTTIMVGFPGETEEKFEKLCEFIRDARFERLGVFSYSPEKGTAAARLKPQISPAVAESRAKEIMKIQAEISLQLNKEMVGRDLPVLIEGFSSETDLLLRGRTSTMAPDIDGQVLINEGNACEGEIVPVRITEAHTHDIIGRIQGKGG